LGSVHNKLVLDMKLRYILNQAVLMLTTTGLLYAQTPNISKVDKISGTYAELVTISGSGFSANKNLLSVHFGAAKGQIVNSTEFVIEVQVPPGADYDNISVTNLSSKLTGYAPKFFSLAFNGETFQISKIKQSLKINEDKELFDLCDCDFNGDGLNDIASTNNSDDVGATAITVYQNITQPADTEIKFQKINDLNLNTGRGARNITCADLDGDGKPELVVGKGGGNADRIYVFKNVSTTGIKFDPFVTILLSESVSSSTTRRLKIHDLDNDGKPDIIMTDQGLGKVFIFGNKSANGVINFPSSARQVISTSAGSLVGLDVADLNNDSKPEIVCNSDKSNIFIFPNESVPGSIIMGTPRSLTVSGANLVNLKIADLDNDGDKDIVVTNLVNNIYALVNIGTENNFEFSSPRYIETGRLPWGLDIGDLNGDGLVDIVVTTTDVSNKLTALINKSTASNVSFTPFEIGNADVSFNVIISDLSGDGKPDIGYVNRVSGNNELVFLRNTHCVLSGIKPENPSAICSNKPVTLTATPALKVDYTWTNIGTGQNIPGGITASITQAGRYAVTIRSAADGCESVSEIVELLDGGDNLPQSVSITSPGVVCAGQSFQLSAPLTAGVNYYWSTPNETVLQGNSITINNAGIEDAGRYALVLESSGCRTDPVSVLVNISSIPTMDISASSGALFCQGTTNELSAPFFNASQYEWKKNGNIITGVTGNTYNSNESGTFLVTVTNAYGCKGSSNSLTIKEVAQPVASFAPVTSSCLNEKIQFQNTSTYDATETPVFQWDFGDGSTSTEKNPAYTYTKSGTFKVTLQVGYNNTICRSNYESTISVSQFLNLDIKADGNPIPNNIFDLCSGNDVELSVVATPGQIVWSTGETSPKITVKQAGLYTVASAGNSGCSSSDQVEVRLVENVVVEITSGAQRIESGSSAQLGAKGADFYEWSPPENLDNAKIPNPLASPLETTEYTVVGSNMYGCTDSATVKVYVDEKIVIKVDAPRSFTPNGDGRNDVWIIRNIDIYESCPITIFNRRGQNVYEASQYNNDWDGIFNGTELPEGAYYFVMTCGPGEVHTGDITLIR
jgi:gliding motility-associated-like protein